MSSLRGAFTSLVDLRRNFVTKPTAIRDITDWAPKGLQELRRMGNCEAKHGVDRAKLAMGPWSALAIDD
jgi:hypothetical protein